MRTTDAGPLLEAEHAVARILGDTERPADVAKDLIAAIGVPLGWEFGAGWRLDGDELQMVDVWSDGSLSDGDLAAICATDRLGRGVGLPGRVWASGEPAWIFDVGDDSNLPRRAAVQAAGLRSAFCFPIVGPQAGFAGAVEFFTRERVEPDERLLDTMASLGRRMGHAVDRDLADRALRSSEATGRAILAAALDCVVTMDQHGHVLEWNPAAERTFGYDRDEVLGRDMADLIVPPRLRDQHRRGLARYLATGKASVLDRRIEITATRRDGHEFPVELAITRIAVKGPPVFTGHIRDITVRRHQDAELRASRARVLEAADSERRRIERDLHDGAQQRLVALALNLRLARSRIDGPEPQSAAELLDEAIEELHAATAELRELARGIHPAVLTDRGLDAALKALAARSAVPAAIENSCGDDLPAPVAAAVWFVVSEALTNVARYAAATRAEVCIERVEGGVAVEVRDDGAGGADPSRGSGLRGLHDRVATLDGMLSVLSPPGEGTVVRAEIPCE
jgi:PAS domain S-box-containing protein